MVDALRKLHDALVLDGKLIDTQPVSPRPAVFIAGKPIGSLDLREWELTIAAVDAEIERALGDGVFTLEAEERITVTDFFDSGSECLGEVQEWAGTRVPKALEAKIRAATAPVTVEQEVRLRLLAKSA